MFVLQGSRKCDQTMPRKTSKPIKPKQAMIPVKPTDKRTKTSTKGPSKPMPAAKPLPPIGTTKFDDDDDISEFEYGEDFNIG